MGIEMLEQRNALFTGRPSRLPCAAMTEDDRASSARRASVDAILKSQDWGRIHAQLVASAKARTKSPAMAEDLAQEAIRRVLDPNWEPWDPEKEPSLPQFLMRIVSRLVSNERTHSRAHREIVMDREAAEGSRERRVARKAGGVAVDASSPEAQAIARQLYLRRIDRLHADVAEDAVTRALVEQAEEGNDKASEQAAATGYSIEKVREGRRRLARHVDRITREIPAESEKESK
jgi:DNA-directed RNA polymerase specialized sigma24 family protein